MQGRTHMDLTQVYVGGETRVWTILNSNYYDCCCDCSINVVMKGETIL